MFYIKLFESVDKGLDLLNEVKNHLSQFPYLSYGVKRENSSIVITFNKDVTAKYAKGLLDSYDIEVKNENPVTIIIKKKKNVDKFEEFNGKTIIENIEHVDFPDIGIKKLKVKIDSGATTSSIGVSKMKIDRNRKKVTFVPLDDKYDEYRGKSYTMDLYSEIKVQSSNGDEESRPLIKLDIVIKGKTFESYFTLANREELEFPVLIGKDVLSGNFLINPGL